MANTWAKKEPLIAAHINGLSVTVIERHLKCFRDFIGGGKSGIYILRKDRKCYYVGLASSLRKRLPDHIKDHLRGKWDDFDLYIIRKGKTKYLKELETLLIRVAKPEACKVEPKFAKHNNLTKKFKKALMNEVSGLVLG